MTFFWASRDTGSPLHLKFGCCSVHSCPRLFVLIGRRPAILRPTCANSDHCTLRPHISCPFSPQTLRRLRTTGVCRAIATNEIVLQEGYPADHVFLLCSGQITVLTSSVEGRLLILRTANAGEILGLEAVPGTSVYCVTAQALSPCTVMALPREDYLSAMDSYPQLSQLSVQALARDFSCAVLAARRLALSTSAAGKLACALLDWTQTHQPGDIRSHDHLPVHFPAHVTHEELGRMSGLSRETVCRLIAQFRREGLIHLDRRYITLVDPDRLEGLYCERPHPAPSISHSASTPTPSGPPPRAPF